MKKIFKKGEDIYKTPFLFEGWGFVIPGSVTDKSEKHI